MLTRAEEQAIYRLSVLLGQEVYLLGCGAARFLPKQRGAAGSVNTVEGDLGMADWMVYCATHPEERPFWVHTHPEFEAFFSATDVEGSHALYGNIGRPFDAVVLGDGGSRFQVEIDEKWLEKHPKPRLVVKSARENLWGHRIGWDIEGGWEPREWGPKRSEPSLEDLVEGMVRVWGASAVLDALSAAIRKATEGRAGIDLLSWG